VLERDEVIDLQRRGLEAFLRIIAGGAQSSQLLTFPGVTAAAVPAAAERSFVNSIVYRSAGDLAAAIDPLAATYRSRGVHAWTVWVPEGDHAATEVLATAGHELDASPAAMALELADLPEPELEGLDWDDGAEASEVARLNDIAYGWAGDGGFADAFTAIPDRSLRLFRARVDGAVACVAGTIDAGSDCVLVMVATPPERRGKGLARRLCHAALEDARDRGLKTSTLQATKLGRPVYERLGYRTYGAMEMWERREA
jgi:GNAT superfamily N-acetyltransferase